MLNVVVIEDDEADATAIRRASSQLSISHVLSEARDADQAMALLRSGEVPLRWALVVLDLGLPRVSGLQLLEQLRADDTLRFLPVVVLSSSVSPENLQQAHGFNVSGYFQKPDDQLKLKVLFETIVAYWSAAALHP